MKKLLASLLALVLALTLAAPALAAPAPDAAPEDIIPISGILDGDFDWYTVEQAYVDEIKTALGGVPGQIGVMVNGVYVKFPDAAPEISNGRTMIPVRALVETLGGEIGYQGGVVTFTIDGYVYQFAIGKTTVTVTPAAGNDKDTPKPDDIVMDCAPYIKGGRTYVPVRFISEALGYEVGWDGSFQTAVLLDREAVAAQYDETFTILNKVQANQGITMEEGKNYKADVKGNLTVTAFDTLNGNQTYKADLSASQILNTESASAKLSLKVSDNVVDDLMQFLISANAPEEDIAEVREAAQMVVDCLEDVELIVTRKGLGWVRAAALDELAGQKNVWMGLELGAEWGELAFAQTGEATIGSALAAMIDVDSVESLPIEVSPAAQLLYELYGDDKFTTSGGVSTRTIGVDDLFAVYEAMGMALDEADLAEAKAAFQEFSITMKVDGKGAATMTCVMQTAPLDGVPGLKLTMDVKQDSGNAAISMTLHIANIGEGRLTLTQTWSATSEKPQDQPPEGAIIVDAAELLNP